MLPRKGVLYLVPPNENIRYYWYFYIPKNSEIQSIVIWGHGSSKQGMSYQEMPEYFKIEAESIASFCEGFGLFMIMPILPRDYSEKEFVSHKLDSQMMTREVMVHGVMKGNPFYRRPDIEILKMLKKAEDICKQINLTIKLPYSIGGISAGANMANRLSMLYPGLFLNVVLMMAGDFMYPLKHLDGLDLNYPFGIHNIDNIFGNQYKLHKVKQLRHFIYVGEDDENPQQDPLPFELNDDARLIHLHRLLLGDTQFMRTLSYAHTLKTYDIPFILKLGEHMGHTFNAAVMNEAFQFIEKSYLEMK